MGQRVPEESGETPPQGAEPTETETPGRGCERQQRGANQEDIIGKRLQHGAQGQPEESTR